MRHCEYLVVLRSKAWWVIADGAPTGPYVSLDVAKRSAIAFARTDFRTGKSARVSVDEPDDGIPVIYDSRPEAGDD